MRILILISAFHPHKGGVEEIGRQLTRVYRQKGHHVLVVTQRWPHSLSAAETLEGQLVLRLPMPLPGYRHARSLASFVLRFVPSCFHILRIGIQWRPDVVQIQCIGPNGLYGLILTQLLHLPLVITSHGEQTLDAGRLYERSATQRWVLRRLIRHAVEISADSASALQGLKPYRLPDNTGTVIYNGVEVMDFQAPSPSLSSRPYILAIGRHVENKGFDVLLRAYAPLASRHANVDLIVAGDGPEHQTLMQLAAELHIVDRVVFPGPTDRLQTAAYFRHCLFFVLPSLTDSFPVVNLEAMAAGKAVIATCVGDVSILVQHDLTGLLVPPGDPGALTNAMEKLVSNPGYATQLGETGRQTVRDNYSWDKIAGQDLALYDQVLTQQLAIKGASKTTRASGGEPT